MCNTVRHAVHQELIEHNPTANLDGITAPPVKHHCPALKQGGLPELLARISDYQQGRELTRMGGSFTLHLFIRSSELRFARWSEIDFRNKIWTIPATREAITILKQISEISGHQELIIPGDHNLYKPMNENTVNKALRLMGYYTKEDICGHGFRTMASSALMESGLCSQDAVERQMSHQERNSV